MFSLTTFPSTTAVLSMYTTFAALAMVVRTVFNELNSVTSQFIPQSFKDKVLAKIGCLFSNLSSQMTLFIDAYSDGTLSINEVYQASDTYLSTRITPSNEKLKVSKTARDKNISVAINKGEKIVEEFEGIWLVWEFLYAETTKSYYDFETCGQSSEITERKTFQLSFHKKFKDRVLNSYLPYVMEKARALNDETKVLKLSSLGNSWSSVDFHHPSTFETLAMDERLKKEMVDDLDRFVKRKEFYKRVGKAWKRGYLLYGPPGMGKSSLVAAMANYLKFNVYDLELTQLHSNSDLRRLLVSTENRSVIVIEDIDCSVELQDRRCGGYNESDGQLTLSGLLNFIDGLWSSCGDERIIVITTNYKDKLDPALLRPGRMDMHIHMFYCTPCGFKTLAFNYLQINSHPLFGKIEEMIKELELTPAEVAGEVMKSDEPDIALQGLVEFLRRKEMKFSEQVNIGQEDNTAGEGEYGMDVKEGQNKRAKKNKSKKARSKRGKY